MVVRWLGAFRKNSGSLHESLSFELSRSSSDEVATEPLARNMKRNIKISYIDARVGLVVKTSAIIKVFKGDCWSEYNEDGKLKKTKKPNSKSHWETWAHPIYVGIIVKDFASMTAKHQKTIMWFCDVYHLPVLNFRFDGKIKEVKKMNKK